ncbi:hypothetical protein DQ244_10565 [Blastococcus sp. TBT05-19]|nr:hypothetical protein DQ244_10565 [Blastococcus sp. TBT05-19]
MKNPALGAAAIVAVLAAVGVAGDLLPRLVRNHPVITAVIVGVAVVSVFVLLVPLRRAPLVGTVLLGVALLAVVGFGAWSQTAREIPQVSLGVTTEGDVATVAVVAGATSQRSTETMLVQVLGFPADVDPVVLSAVCRGSHRMDDALDDRFSVLLWNESGPDQTGKVAVDTTLGVTADAYAVVCVGVFLRERDRNSPTDDRFTWAYTALR